MTGSRIERASQAHTTGRITAIGFAKATSVLWIFVIHIAGATFGFSLAANPTDNWGSLSDRISQWSPVGSGPWAWLGDLLRWVGWLGENAVGVFLFVSGVVLTMSLARTDDVGGWLRRRYVAILPGWLLVNAGLLVASKLFSMPSEAHLGDKNFWLGLFGLRFLPESMYYGCAAWWYVGMLVQLYLVFPPLFALVRRLGPVRTMTILLPALLIVRLIGLLVVPEGFLDVWSSGGIVVSRLPEVVVGMALTLAWLDSRVVGFDTWLRTHLPLRTVGPVAVVGAVLSFVTSFVLPGMTVMPVLGTVSYALLLLHAGAAIGVRRGKLPAPLAWLDSRAWEFYLVHMIVVTALLRPVDLLGWSTLGRAVAAFVVSAACAEILHRLSAPLSIWLRARLGAGRQPVGVRN